MLKIDWDPEYVLTGKKLEKNAILFGGSLEKYGLDKSTSAMQIGQ